MARKRMVAAPPDAVMVDDDRPRCSRCKKPGGFGRPLVDVVNCMVPGDVTVLCFPCYGITRRPMSFDPLDPISDPFAT